jgi:hypothetical protein
MLFELRSSHSCTEPTNKQPTCKQLFLWMTSLATTKLCQTGTKANRHKEHSCVPIKFLFMKTGRGSQFSNLLTVLLQMRFNSTRVVACPEDSVTEKILSLASYHLLSGFQHLLYVRDFWDTFNQIFKKIGWPIYIEMN